MKKRRRKELGKDLKDLSKITFATGFLGAIMANDSVNNLLLILATLIFTIGTAILGFYLTKGD